MMKTSRRKIIFLLPALLVLALYLIFANKTPYATKNSNDLERLRAIPYAAYSKKNPLPEKNGVVFYDRKKSYPGYNLYCDSKESVFLTDMGGKVIHQWKMPAEGRWEYAVFTKEGDLLVLCESFCLVKVDRDANIIWNIPMHVHHDIEILPNGNFLALFKSPPVLYAYRPVLFDNIAEFSPDGKLIEAWSIRKLLGRSDKYGFFSPLDRPNDSNTIEKVMSRIYFLLRNFIFEKRHEYRMKKYTSFKGSQKTKPANWKKLLYGIALPINRWFLHNFFKTKIDFDYYHLNAIKLLPKNRLEEKDKRFRQGNYLICLRNINLVAILDQETKEVLWYWGPGVLDGPHLPVMLANGNIVILDNGLNYRHYSRVIEINPLSKEIVWEYTESPVESFYTRIGGSAQPLPNGNILISETREGRVFEVTRDKEIVWEFLNPQTKENKRRSIYRLIRLPESKIKPLLSAE